MKPIELIGKVKAMGFGMAGVPCKSELGDKATIELNPPDLSSLKEGDEVLVKGKVFDKVPKKEIADPNEMAKISISQWNRVVEYLEEVRKHLKRLETNKC